MNRKAATAALAAMPLITARILDGEWRVTIKPSAICERFPEMTRTQCQAKGEAMACYTDDHADAVGTAQHMAAHWSGSAPVRKVVFQDAATFYVGTNDATEQTATAPMQVLDSDMAAAERARDWFVSVWCTEQGIAPHFTGEAF